MLKLFPLVSLASLLMAASAVADSSAVKIGYIDPLSGAGASTGAIGQRIFHYLADQTNEKGGLIGKKIDITDFDSKANAQAGLEQARKALDDGIHIVIQGNGSSVGAALEDFVTKNNNRNPDNVLLYLNYNAIDPSLTNEKCSYWHFRWAPSVDMKMEALTNYIKNKPDVKKVYIIGQDYSFGQAVSAQAKKMLTEKRPDIQIVGNELHPLLKVTDFSPYIAKIKASGADTVITGNWGQDLTLLLKAAGEAGLTASWYTYYVGAPGDFPAVKQAGLADKVYAILDAPPLTDLPPDSEKLDSAFRAKFSTDIFQPEDVNLMSSLDQAVKEANSDDPKAVAAKLEHLKITAYQGGEAWIRPDDHQFMQDMFMSSMGPLQPAEDVAKLDQEGTGWGWHLKGRIAAKDTVLPTTCKMDRPD
jgi:branched-chain amino acid transport system substrate-binding protein